MAMRKSCTWHRSGETVVVTHFTSKENIRSPEELHYTLGKTIGSGTYAKVKAAWCPYERKMIAIKIMEKHGATEQFLKKFLPREMQALQQLRHPNLLRVYRLVETPDQVYFMLEMAQNGDLLDYMNTVHRVPEPEARFIMRSISAGIAHCHSKNIIHRDLKCENIMVTKEMTIKIGDFGFCRHIDDCSGTLTPCGSFSYAAPELFLGPPGPATYDGKKADIWSMGCILYTIVCGCLPFGDDCEAARNVCKPLKFPMLLSEECKYLLGYGMLNLDVAMRCTVEQVRISHWMRGPTSPLTRRNPTLHTAEECLPEVLLDPFFAEDAHYITESSSSTANSVPVSIEQPPKQNGATCHPSSPVTVPPSDTSLSFETNPFNGLSLTEPSEASANSLSLTAPNGPSTPLNPLSRVNPEMPSNPFEVTPVAPTQNGRKKAAEPHLYRISNHTVNFPSSMPMSHPNLNFEPSATYPFEYPSPSEPSCSSETSTNLTNPTSLAAPVTPTKPTSLAAPSTPGTPKTREVHRRKKTAVAHLHQRKRILDDPSSVIITSPTPLVKPTSIKEKISSAGKKLVQTISKHASPTSK